VPRGVNRRNGRPSGLQEMLDTESNYSETQSARERASMAPARALEVNTTYRPAVRHCKVYCVAHVLRVDTYIYALGCRDYIYIYNIYCLCIGACVTYM
jgi:hypothetical protein